MQISYRAGRRSRLRRFCRLFEGCGKGSGAEDSQGFAGRGSREISDVRRVGGLFVRLSITRKELGKTGKKQETENLAKPYF